MSTAQYYQVRLEDAISLYREGNLTACGLLKLYIKIKFAPGWQIGLIPEQVCKVLGIAKATFYKALAKVKEQDNLKQIKFINKIGSSGIPVVNTRYGVCVQVRLNLS